MTLPMGNFQTNTIFKETKYFESEYNQEHFTTNNLQKDSKLQTSNILTGISDVFLNFKKTSNRNTSRIFDQLEKASLKNELLSEQLDNFKVTGNINEDTNIKRKAELLELEANKYFIKGLKFEESNDFNKAIENYQTAINLDSNFYDAILNSGIILINIANSKQREDSEKIYLKAIEKLKEATYIDPSRYEAYENLGLCLEKLAVNKSEKDTERLLEKAVEYYKNAIENNTDLHKLFHNLGNVLSKLSELKENQNTEKLLKEAIENYKQAIKVKPDYFEVYVDWSISLSGLADLKEGDEAKKYNNEAYDKLHVALEFGNSLN